MIKCVLFDLDGVLVDACEWHYEALNLALQEISNIEISRDEHVTTFNGLPTKTKLNILTEQGRLSEADHDEIWNRKQDVTEEVIRKNCLQNEGIDNTKVKLFQGLKESGIRTGCVTNSIRRTATLMLESTGQLDEGLEILITNEDVKNPKPDPEGYTKAISHFGFDPEEVLIVEDSDKGFQAASESGAHVMRVVNATEVTFEKVKSYIESL